MTISSQSRKAGPFTGNGSTIAFPFAFKVFVASDVYVVRANTSGVETVLTSGTDYSVTLNSNQNSNPGGTVTLSAALATNFKLVITSAVPNLQPVDITNNGGFYPKVINDALDRVTIMAQQIAQEAGRGIKLPITSSLTSDQFTEQLFDARDEAVTSASNAATSASAAAASATSASGSATTATTKASEASTSASGAASSATAASGSATAAAGSATTAGNSATTATNKANEAASSATAAAASATAAAGSATTATTQAATATTQASNAATSASNASTSATAAGNSASAAATSATSANNSATSATNSANSAASSASSANTSATNAAASQTAAAGSASAASTSATNAATSATNAASSATNAASSATSAGNSATAAAASAAAAAASFDAFDDIYLGAKSSNPTVDNDGNALTVGDQYFNTTANELRVYNGSAWQAASTVGGTVTSLNVTGEATLGFFNGQRSLFAKTNSSVVAWTKTGAGTATTSSTLYIEVDGALKIITSGTSITMPALTAGTDYAIWAKPDGTLEATSNHTSPPVANSRKVGGFHYAAGSNATGTSGGNTTPQINEYSFWDLKFKPNCADPRGMTLVGGGYWMDIYLTGIDAITNGSSKYNVTMADGSSPPKVPTMFGGNGSTTYGSYTWFEAMELATAFGKRCPTQREFMSAMYGTTEASSIGTDQGSTILNAAYTSKWGVVQSTGVLWVWGDDRGGAYNTGGWNANTEGRGSEYNAPNAVLLGGGWGSGSFSGSRCSSWYNAASYSNDGIGSRFCCDHLQLD